MPNSIKHPRRLMTILALVLLPVGAVAAMTTANQSDDAGLCEIKATPGAGMVRLDALVHADTHVGGTYTFRVKKSGDGGSSTINQSGDFDATVGHAAILSSVSLGSKGTAYKATLDIVIGDKSFSCSKQVSDN
ncbi:curli-like amyloid fiber formation chaperone CsgH [Rhizobium sp. CNPSo 4039]|uniref:curli-like amyloid fiber formation chaperone CsgH n=1 Tax=Rhizobium sp. CNPSo 4039 TaxID=3021409 RepID=UPI002550B7B5|nr:curli-like amyloid fiber formation chaperone CsgH [Rhizobium sp. CNPSo 4039]MDK4715125.1 curli-like amyloid fiber formation chaperone CsgH [Rhizobium sp. CNPSo 4039]